MVNPSMSVMLGNEFYGRCPKELKDDFSSVMMIIKKLMGF